MEFEKLQNIIAEVLNIEPEEVTMTSTFVDDLGADSLDIFQIIMGIEEEFDIKIPDDAAEKYTEYKKQYQSARQEQTPLEILLSHDPDIGEGGILVVKRLLEEKIELADVRTLKGVICEAEDTDLAISLKGLSVHARRKLFSVISDYKADEYSGHCEYMGPVRQIDVMASMSELIAVFEKQRFV